MTVAFLSRAKGSFLLGNAVFSEKIVGSLLDFFLVVNLQNCFINADALDICRILNC